MATTTMTTPPPPALLLTSGASGRVNALFSLRTIKSLLFLIKASLFFLLLLPFQLRLWRKQPNASAAADHHHVIKDHHQDKDINRITTTKSPFLFFFFPGAPPDAATRRDLAIRNVTLDNHNKTCSLRQFSLFPTSRGDTLFTQSWTPLSTNIRGLVVLLHGLNEHSGRYNDFAKKLNENGFKVYGMDWLGHGGSDGLHAYVPSLDYAVDDAKAFIEKIVSENTALPCFCFAHSTGAAIILKSILDSRMKALVRGVVLTSPAVGVQPSHPIFGVLAPVASFLLPKYQFRAANKNGTIVSRDPEALIAKYSDPLVYTGSIRVRTGYEILCISTYLQQNLSKLTTPFLVLHGTCDGVTDPGASVDMHRKASSNDKSIKLYKGLLHDLLFEPEREIVAKDIIEWLNYRAQVEIHDSSFLLDARIG